MGKDEIPEINSRFLKAFESKGYSGYKLSKEVKIISESKLTHIRSGRNEPSRELINALIQKFPDININWILTGDGDMLFEKSIIEIDEPLRINNNNELLITQKKLIASQEARIKSLEKEKETLKKELKECEEKIFKGVRVPRDA